MTITVVNWQEKKIATIEPMINGWVWNIYNNLGEEVDHDCSTDHLDNDCENTYGKIEPKLIGYTFTDWYKWENFTVITQE